VIVLARRLAQLVAVVLAVTFLTFTAMNTLGDPLFNVVGFVAAVDCDAVEAGEIEDISGQGGTSLGDCAVVAEAREEFHLNEPLPIRYGRWVGPDTGRLRHVIQEADAWMHGSGRTAFPSPCC
jgi:ABC-type dipeptide/oligopeptide/nickel transport system permease component